MIKITAVSYNNTPLSKPLSAIFGRTGGTLGRSEENAFVLPDSKHIVSRRQAEVRSDGAQHVIANLSRATPMMINGTELNFGDEHPLKAGDEIQIGMYVLRAEPHLTPVDTQIAAARERSLADTGAPVTVTGAVVFKATQTASAPSSTPQVPAMAQPEKAVAAEALSAPGDNHPLIQAFLNGAGIGHTGLNADLTPEFMETMGKLVATAVQGTFELLASRSSMKREVKADVTMIVLRNNNPLKFLADSETILVQMLRKKMPGFMGPAEAMQDAYEDLQAHQVGMVAGMHAAVDEVLKRFDPAALEKRLKERSMFDAVLPAQRKARMWDQYTVLFDGICEDAQHDFDALFSKAFVAAYEKEIDRFYNEQ
jgi:FHA domain-containing protein